MIAHQLFSKTDQYRCSNGFYISPSGEIFPIAKPPSLNRHDDIRLHVSVSSKLTLKQSSNLTGSIIHVYP